MDFHCGGLLFSSKFDSGNLARVEKVIRDDGNEGLVGINSGQDARPDYEFNVWTSPDCAETAFENGNRSWFYFSVKGGSPGKVIQIRIQNLNRQGKLYSQGHTVFVKTVPGKPKWERVRERPSFENVDGQFLLKFSHRLVELRGVTTYFAFCYPWSYSEQQLRLKQLDDQHHLCSTYNSKTSPSSMYYHREVLAHSLDGCNIDLITISDCKGIGENEPYFDDKLFPNRKKPRCKAFKNKRVYFVSSRVHPGETPASYVFNGFLDFILRENDPRAKQLRRSFVFKLIPMMNPDGVQRGHYRTDSRGVNLNRVYVDPDFNIHPSIYAAKSVMVYYHVANRKHPKEHNHAQRINSKSPKYHQRKSAKHHLNSDKSCVKNPKPFSRKDSTELIKEVCPELPANVVGTEDVEEIQSLMLNEDFHNDLNMEKVESHYNSGAGSSENDCEKKSNSTQEESALVDKMSSTRIGNEASDGECSDFENIMESRGIIHSPHLADQALNRIPPEESGIALYVDLHGHASKRGCFIYGNHFENEDLQMENMLFCKLISLNTAHFDFGGCNFTERNMYMKDKRDGMSKEGSGRVSMHKTLGIIRSYTLECNYNTGRLVNTVPPSQGDDGRATPPPMPGFPPRYTQAHFEEVGRAMAVSALDIWELNPWSRLVNSEYCSIHGVRDWLRKYLRGIRGPTKNTQNRPHIIAKHGNMNKGWVQPSAGSGFIPRVAVLAQQKAAERNALRLAKLHADNGKQADGFSHRRHFSMPSDYSRESQELNSSSRSTHDKVKRRLSTSNVPTVNRSEDARASVTADKETPKNSAPLLKQHRSLSTPTALTLSSCSIKPAADALLAGVQQLVGGWNPASQKTFVECDKELPPNSQENITKVNALRLRTSLPISHRAEAVKMTSRVDTKFNRTAVPVLNHQPACALIHYDPTYTSDQSDPLPISQAKVKFSFENDNNPFPGLLPDFESCGRQLESQSSLEEEKIQQLRKITNMTRQKSGKFNQARPLEAPRSDPLHRRIKTGMPIKKTKLLSKPKKCKYLEFKPSTGGKWC